MKLSPTERKALEDQVFKDLEEHGPKMFKNMALDARLRWEQPIAFETVQSMYVSALMSGVQIGMKALVDASDAGTQADEPDVTVIVVSDAGIDG